MKYICNTCGNGCKNARKGWSCASKDQNSSPEFLKIRRTKKLKTVKKGWIHVHAGLPYSGLFDLKTKCLADIHYKSNNNVLSRARRATITTITTWD